MGERTSVLDVPVGRWPPSLPDVTVRTGPHLLARQLSAPACSWPLSIVGVCACGHSQALTFPGFVRRCGEQDRDRPACLPGHCTTHARLHTRGQLYAGISRSCYRGACCPSGCKLVPGASLLCTLGIRQPGALRHNAMHYHTTQSPPLSGTLSPGLSLCIRDPGAGHLLPWKTTFFRHWRAPPVCRRWSVPVVPLLSLCMQKGNRDVLAPEYLARWLSFFLT